MLITLHFELTVFLIGLIFDSFSENVAFEMKTCICLSKRMPYLLNGKTMELLTTHWHRYVIRDLHFAIARCIFSNKFVMHMNECYAGLRNLVEV